MQLSPRAAGGSSRPGVPSGPGALAAFRGVCAGTAAPVSAAGESCGSVRAPACVRARSPRKAYRVPEGRSAFGPCDPGGAMSVAATAAPSFRQERKFAVAPQGGPCGCPCRPVSRRVGPGRGWGRGPRVSAAPGRPGQGRGIPGRSQAAPRAGLGQWGGSCKASWGPPPPPSGHASGRRGQPRPAGPPPGCKGRCGATGEDAGWGLLSLPLRRASTGHSFPGGFPPCFLDGPRPGVR